MIGQTFLKGVITEQFENETFPQFAIFVGPKGCGKKTFLSEMFRGIYIEDNKVESVRKIIEMAYKVSGETFIIPDADDMSVNAKNALLKVVEECPNDNHFIMTLQDGSNTLPTILSRAFVYNMDIYTYDELVEYCESLDVVQEDIEKIVKVAENPGDVNLIVSYDPTTFIGYVNLVVDNIATVDSANAFKSANKLAIKSDEGYDLSLFFRTFCKLCSDRFIDGMRDQNYLKGIVCTYPFIQKLWKVGVNRGQIYDMWVITVRSALWN